MWKLLKTKPLSPWEKGIYGILILGLVGAYFWRIFQPSQAVVPMKMEQPEYETILPKISESFASQKFIGRIVSHSFAMIHPRREGIVRDILVDTGDTVSAGQVVAYLFPPGVEGQSASAISRAAAELQSAQEALATVRAVSTEIVEMAQKNVDILQISGASERSKLEQQYDNARTVMTQEVQNLRRIFIGNDKRTEYVSQILGTFGNTLLSQKVFNEFKEVERLLGTKIPNTEVSTTLSRIEELLAQTEELYRSAKSSSQMSAEVIEQRIRGIQAGQTKILAAEAGLDNALLALQTANQNVNLVSSQAENSLTSAKSRVDIARAAYQNVLSGSGNIQVTSPFVGTIVSRGIDVGEMVMPGQMMFEVLGAQTSLGQKSSEEVQFEVSEEFLGEVEEGDSVQVIVPGKEESFSATVTRKSSALDSKSNMAQVHAEIEDGSLPHNTRVMVLLIQEESPVLSVPSSVLKRKGNENFLWVVVDENPYHVPVEILAEDGELSDIIAPGVTRESNVIAEPSVRLWRTSEPMESVLNPLEDD